MMKNNVGVLLPVFSLPSNHGIGDFGDSCYKFISWLSKNHFRYWQILPLNPLGDGTSPYTSTCSKAIDIRFICLDYLVEKGLLESVPDFHKDDTSIKYKKVEQFKETYLKIAYKKYKQNGIDGLIKFKSRNPWVNEYATYCVFKRINNNLPWNKWDKKYIEYFKKHNCPPSKYIDEINYYSFIQYIAHNQWKNVLSFARRRNVKIIADLPFYVGYDSVECWINNDEFLLDEKYNPTFVGGVPPDYFNENGQVWGNPIYDFEKMEKNNFSFLVDRIGYLSKMCDILRLDHFRAWDTYCVIPFGDENAKNGEWKLGPATKFFDELYKSYPSIDLIAEDLGEMRKEVYELRDHYNLPGMYVAQFCILDWEKRSNNNMIVYSGTHDNQTLYGWFKSLNNEQIATLENRLIYPSNLYNALFEYIYNAPSKFTIFPLQDLLKWDDRARVNWPGTCGDPNFCFRLKDFSWTNKVKFTNKKH